jgi:hypothetical protein
MKTVEYLLTQGASVHVRDREKYISLSFVDFRLGMICGIASNKTLQLVSFFG